MMMCTTCMSNYYLCDFLEIIDNKKFRGNYERDNNVYILHVKRYTLKICSELRRYVHDDMYILHVKRIIFKNL
jgi:hypothetical protein